MKASVAETLRLLMRMLRTRSIAIICFVHFCNNCNTLLLLAWFPTAMNQMYVTIPVTAIATATATHTRAYPRLWDAMLFDVYLGALFAFFLFFFLVRYLRSACSRITMPRVDLW